MSEHGLARIQVAAMLRRMREQAKVSREQAAAVLYCTPAKIGDLERGRSMVKPLDLEKLLDLYGVLGTDRVELETVARNARRRRSADEPGFARWNQRHVDLEAQCRSFSFYTGELIPGFLQTEGYMRAMCDDGTDFYTEEGIQERVASRVARRAAMTRSDPPPPAGWCVIGEAALRSNVGGPAVMAEQLDLLLDWTLHQRHIGIQVLPTGSGAHGLIGMIVTLLRFEPPAGSLVHQVTWAQDIYSESQDDVDRVERAFDRLKARALDLDPSREVLRGIAREYRERSGRAPLERVVHPAAQQQRKQLRRDAPDP